MSTWKLDAVTNAVANAVTIADAEIVGRMFWTSSRVCSDGRMKSEVMMIEEKEKEKAVE